MGKFIPYEKLSGKKTRELDLKKRRTRGISPVTRRPKNPKAYNRSKARRRDREDLPDAFFYGPPFVAGRRQLRFAGRDFCGFTVCCIFSTACKQNGVFVLKNNFVYDILFQLKCGYLGTFIHDAKGDCSYENL